MKSDANETMSTKTKQKYQLKIGGQDFNCTAEELQQMNNQVKEKIQMLASQKENCMEQYQMEIKEIRKERVLAKGQERRIATMQKFIPILKLAHEYEQENCQFHIVESIIERKENTEKIEAFFGPFPSLKKALEHAENNDAIGITPAEWLTNFSNLSLKPEQNIFPNEIDLLLLSFGGFFLHLKTFKIFVSRPARHRTEKEK